MAQLAGALGGLALLLAALGLYGLTSYAIARRRAEIAIRIALGARPRAVMALVLTRVTLLVGTGILAGAVISLWAAQFIDGLLYGLHPREPATLVGAAVVLCGVVSLAVWGPTRRATRMDPLAALRES